MTREEKKDKRIQRAIDRVEKNKERNFNKLHNKIQRNPDRLLDCPFDVEMNNTYGTCTCNHYNYNTCAMDV